MMNGLSLMKNIGYKSEALKTQNKTIGAAALSNVPNIFGGTSSKGLVESSTDFNSVFNNVFSTDPFKQAEKIKYLGAMNQLKNMPR